jgi:hypothetical protein
VNLEKLVKQLKRDLTANPKKAAVLGVMVLVAGYFWGPLLWKFAASGAAKSKTNTSMVGLILTDDPADPAQQTKQASASKFHWEKVRQLIQQDDRMASASFDVAWVDPFAKSMEAGIAAEVETSAEDPAAVAAAAQAAAAAELDPAELGVVLGGVMVGRRTRVATINGEPCHEGDVISVPDKTDKELSHEFKVVRISRQMVQLEMSGRLFALEIIQSKLNHGDEVERGKHRPRTNSALAP